MTINRVKLQFYRWKQSSDLIKSPWFLQVYKVNCSFMTKLDVVVPTLHNRCSDLNKLLKIFR